MMRKVGGNLCASPSTSRVVYAHFGCFGFVLPVEELWEGSAFDRVHAGGERSPQL